MPQDLFAPPTPDELKQAQGAKAQDLFAPPTPEELQAAKGDNRSMSQKHSDFEKLSPEDKKKALESSLQGSSAADAPGRLRTGARSALEMLSLGTSEPVFAGMHAVDRTVKDAQEAGYNVLHGKDTDFNPLDSLEGGYNEDVDQRRAEKEKYSTSNLVGGIGGALLPAGPAAALVGKASGLVGRGANAIRGLLPEIEATSKLGKAGLAAATGAGKVAQGAAEGAGAGIAMEVPRQIAEGTTGFIKDGDKDVPDLGDVGKVGALVGGGIPAAGMALRAAGSVAGSAGKKILSSFLGPSEAHIDYYLAHPEAVNGAKSLEEVKDKVDGITESLRADVESGKMSVGEAKAQIKDVEQAVTNHRNESNFDFAVTATKIRQQFRDAKDALSKAMESHTNALKSIKAPTDLADEAVQATKDLRGKVAQGSADATKLISPETEVETYSPYQVLKQAQARLSPAGTGPITPQAQAAHQEIQKLMDTFGALPGKMNGNQTKSLIQQLDASQKAVYNSGEFTDDVEKAYKSIRAQLDEQLKAQNVPYAAAMKGVAADTQLHSDVVGRFGDQGGAASALNTIAGPAKAAERANLAKLGQATGRDFETPINAHVKAQGILKSPEAMQALEQSLPEHSQMLEAEKANRMIEGPEAKSEFVNRRLQDSGLLGKQTEAEGLLAKKQGLLDQAQAKAEPFSNFTPKTSETRLKTVMNAKPGEQIEHIRQLEELSKLSDTDFVRALEDLRTKQAFEGGRAQGSRRVNLFTIITSGLTGAVGGAAHGFVGAGVGAAAGGTIGALADHYGPAMTKKILDGVIKVQRSPKLATIQALNLPPEAKAFLSREFADFSKATPAIADRKGNGREASGD